MLEKGAEPVSLLARSLWTREDCVSCSGPAPVCNCAAGEQCILIPRSCTQCPSVTCIKGASSGSGGVNPGIIAGPIVAVLVIASAALFWYLRRKKRRDLARLEELAARARAAENAGFSLSQPGSASPYSARSTRSGPTSSKSRNSQQQRQAQSATSPRSAGTFGFDRRSPLPSSGQLLTAATEMKTSGRSGGGAMAMDPSWPGAGGPGGPGGGGGGGGDPFDDRHSQLSGGTTETDGTRIIPIQYAPGQGGAEPSPSRTAQAARTLDEARQNLFKPKGAPMRPARSPGLNLRAPDDPRGNTSHHEMLSPDGSGLLRSPVNHHTTRDSFLSGVSGAPSFLSGTTDLYVDAPKIMTSKNVRVGRLQQAEMVQWGNGSTSAGGPRQPGPGPYGATEADDDGASDRSHETFGAPRRLTPTHQRYDGEQEGLDSPASLPSGSGDGGGGFPAGGPGDLRFSMGSLAYRDSMSSMATSRYHIQTSHAHDAELGSLPAPPSRLVGFSRDAPRESGMSSKSYADSLLGGYPMIPPGSAGPAANHGSGIPTSSSAMTLDLGGPASAASRAHGSPGRSAAAPSSFRHPVSPPSQRPAGHAAASIPPPSTPPTAAASTAREAASTRPRPDTQASVADSFLGSFPFVPPNMDDLATLPSAMLPSGVAEQGPDTASNRRPSR